MTRKGSVDNFYENFYNYIFSSEQVYFSELHDTHICEMEEQTTAYSTQTALCMHRGWVGITSASTVLPWYLQFSSLHLYTHEWEGFHWDNILSILQIPQGVNSTGFCLHDWAGNHCNWARTETWISSKLSLLWTSRLCFTTLHWNNPGIPLSFHWPYFFLPNQMSDTAHFRQTSMQNKLKNINFKS